MQSSVGTWTFDFSTKMAMNVSNDGRPLTSSFPAGSDSASATERVGVVGGVARG